MKKENPSKRVVKTSVSIETDILEKGQQLAALMGYRLSFSAFVTALIREKVESCHANIRKPLSA